VIGRGDDVRDRVRRAIAALDVEDLEERVAPVKCNKHPESPECGDYYGIPPYGAPEPPPEGGG
jgi:hypothetical protein